MDKKFQVFISSTYTDLIEERQKCVSAILNAGHIPAGMELFHAGDETQKELISEWISESDIYILILGGRYGSLDEDGKGYTHWEYEKAKELDKPMLSLVLTDDYLDNKVLSGEIKGTDLETSNPKFIEFRKDIMGKIVSQIDNIDQIEAEVLKSINRVVKRNENNLEGWIKGNNLNKLDILNEENKQLSSQLVLRQDEVIKMQKEINEVKDAFIGQYSFEYVKSKLSDNPVITPDMYLEFKKIKESLEEQNPSGPDNRSFDSDKQILEQVNIIIQEKLTASQMLIRSKDRLLEHSSKISHDLYGKVMNELYISKWYEMSLIDKEEVPGKNISLQNYNHYIPSYERYELNDRGIKYIQMLEIETKK